MSFLVTPDQGVETASKRYQRFEQCLYVAAQSISNKWTMEQFAMCFPTWANEDPDVANRLRLEVSDFMKNNLMKESSDLLLRYDARGAIDVLDQAVAEAKKRQADGTSTGRKDEWKPALDPRSAVRARVLPVLEQEKIRLQRELEELEEQNRQYIARIEQNRAKSKAKDQESKTLLDRFEQVCQALYPMDSEELQQWMLAADEAATTRSD